MANIPIASLLFRRADIVPAPQELRLPLPLEKELNLIAEAGSAWNVLPLERLGLDLKNALRHRISLDLSGSTPSPVVAESGNTLIATEGGEIIWRLPSNNAGVFELRTPRTKVLIGHLDKQRVDLLGGVIVSVGETRGGWCTFALSLLEGDYFDHKPRRALLVATGYTENTDMGWKNTARSTVGTDWGKAPSLVEQISATLQLPKSGGRPLLYPLNASGQRKKPILPLENLPEFTFKLGAPNDTLWYEIDYPSVTPDSKFAPINSQ